MIALFVAIIIVVIVLILLLMMVFKDYLRYKETRDEVRYILNQMHNSINASPSNRTFMEDIQEKVLTY